MGTTAANIKYRRKHHDRLTKPCKTCGGPKPLGRGIRYCSEECRQPFYERQRQLGIEGQKRWKERNFEKVRSYWKERGIRLRQLHNEFLAEAKDHPCMDCGGEFPVYVMDFHHRDPSTKLFVVAQGRGRPRDKLEAEVAKCDLLCSNCHRIRHHTEKENALHST